MFCAHASYRRNSKKSRERECVHCKEKFIPRTTQIACGEGRYCSISCATQVNRQLWDKPAREKATKAFMESIECGRYMPKSGPAHAQWTGGKFVARQRRIKSGVSALQQKRYRKANPEKTREWSSKRNSRKTGRLPKEFVLNLLKLQKSMCPACRTTLKTGYHVDHITPLSKGGKHECLNIQLLCPPCNMRKSAKHSIDFMQEKGFLL